MNGLLDGVQVTELGSSTAAMYCGKVMAELGATVVKFEPSPGGDPSRSYGPFIGKPAGPERSARFIYYNQGKRSVCLDRADPRAAEAVERLAAQSDVLLVDPGDRHFYNDSPCPGTTVLFTGTTHPDHQDWVITDLVAYAIGGYLFLDGAVDRAPLKGGGEQPAHLAANYALTAIMALRFGDRGRPRRHRVEVPLAESLGTGHIHSTVEWTYAGVIRRRCGNRQETSGPIGIYPCTDGFVAVSAHTEDIWARLTVAIGRPDLLDDERLATMSGRSQHHDEIDKIIAAYTSVRSRTQVLAELQELRVTAGLVSTPKDLLEDPQYRARDYWRRVVQPGVGAIEVPGHVFIAEGLGFEEHPAPRLGEHTDEVLRGLGYAGSTIPV